MNVKFMLLVMGSSCPVSQTLPNSNPINGVWNYGHLGSQKSTLCVRQLQRSAARAEHNGWDLCLVGKYTQNQGYGYNSSKGGEPCTRHINFWGFITLPTECKKYHSKTPLTWMQSYTFRRNEGGHGREWFTQYCQDNILFLSVYGHRNYQAVYYNLAISSTNSSSFHQHSSNYRLTFAYKAT